MEITTRVIDDIAIFRIEGDLTRATCDAPTLHDRVKTQLADDKRKIIFNFEKAGFVDSFGVGQIIATYQSAQNLGGSFKLASLPPRLLLTLKTTKIVPLISAYPSEESALASFAETSEPDGV